MIIKVVAALIENDGKFLIAKRATGDESVYGKWEFPGGKVESYEDEFSAIEREIKEEFELDVRACEFLVNNICKYPNKIVDLRLYRCEYIGGSFKLNDHSDYVWVSKEDIFDYDLALADIPLARYVCENNDML